MRLSARLSLLFLALAAILVIAAGIAVVMRNELATGIIVRELASRGTNAKLQVSKLTWNEIVIQNIEVEELAIARAQLTYSVTELLNGQIRTAYIEGLATNIDLTGEAPPFEGLRRLFSEFGAPSQAQDELSAALPPLPVVTLDGARISIRVPESEILFDVFGGLQPNAVGGEIQLSFEAESDPFLATGDLGLLLEGTAISSLSFDANLTDRARAIDFTLNGLSEPLDMDRPELQLQMSGTGSVPALMAFTTLETSQRTQDGTFQLNANGRAALPLNAENLFGAAESQMNFALTLSELTFANPGDIPAWMLDRLNAELSGTLALRQASISSALMANIEFAGNETVLEFSAPEALAILSEDYSLESVDLNAFAASATAFPTPYGTLSAVMVEGNLSDLLSDVSGSLQVHATSPQLTLAAFSARGARLDTRAALSESDEGYRLLLDGPAQFSLEALLLPALLPIEQFNGQVLAATLDLTAQEDGYFFRQSARVRLPELSLAVQRQDAAPLGIQIESGTTDIESGGSLAGPIRFATTTPLIAFEIPEMSLTTRDAQVDVDGTVGGEIDARLHGGTVLHDSENPFYTPLIPDLHLVQNGNDVSFGGELRGSDDFLNISVQGAHDLTTGNGNVRFAVDELSFGRGRATETSISPLLASMENLTGQVDGEANFAWSAGVFDTSGRFEAEGLSFRRNGMTIEDLAAEVSLESLLPARSPPGQHLSIRRIATGIEDVTSLDLRFRIDTTEEGAPRIFTEALSLDIAGGRITAEGGSFDPVTGESDLPLRAENLDLARLLSHIGLEELTGEGQLNGTIPLRMSVGGASIEGAALQAGSTGIVTYRSPRAREALASGGDAVNLMLDALEDFHYESLDLTLNKPIAGDTAITLRLAGNNPAVLDGHPFDLNISLSGDADPLLQALLAGQRLSSQLLRSITDR